MRKILTTVAGASFLLVLAGILSKGIGFLREIVIANYFGIGKEFDLYLVSISFATVLSTTIFYFGQNYFVPLFNKKIAEGKDSDVIFNQTFWQFNVLGWLLYLIMFVFASPILGLFLSDSNPGDLELAMRLFRIYSLTIPLFATISILTAYYHCRRNFLIPAISQLLMNLFLVAIIFIFAQVIGIYAIPVAAVAAMIIQLGYFLFYSKKILKTRYILNIFRSGEKLINKALVYTVIAELLSFSYVIIDRLFFTEVEPGGISALNYATTLYNLPIAIFSFALASAIFPNFSADFYNRRIKELSDRYMNALKMSLIIFVPFSFIVYDHGYFIVNLVLERGAFTMQGTKLTSEVLKFYAPALIALGLMGINNKFLYSIGAVGSYVVILLVAVLLKLAGSIYLVGLFQQNGLAASTSIAVVSLVFVSLFVITRKVRQISVLKIVKNMFLVLVAGFSSKILVDISADYTGFKGSLSEVFKIFTFLAFFVNFLYISNKNEIFSISKLFTSLVRRRDLHD